MLAKCRATCNCGRSDNMNCPHGCRGAVVIMKKMWRSRNFYHENFQSWDFQQFHKNFEPWKFGAIRYSRAAFINFGVISLADIDMVDTFFRIIFKMYDQKISSRTKPRTSSAMFLPQTNYCSWLAIVATHTQLYSPMHAATTCICYCFFCRAACAATNWGVASIRINTVLIMYM